MSGQNAEEHPLDPVDAVLSAHDGDARAAIAELLEDVDYLRNQIAYASLAVSRGYAYGWLPTHERMPEAD